MRPDDLGQLPPDGVHLDRSELVAVVAATRALIENTSPDEANRAHVLTIAVVIADAVEREGGAE